MPKKKPDQADDKDKGDKKVYKPWGLIIVGILVVVIVGGFFGLYAGSNAVAASRYEALIESGEAAAVVRIPRFGDDYAVPVISGTSLDTLRRGLGWYDRTAAPGQIGNFGLTGHRFGWGEPFANLETLVVGDEIRVTVGEVTFTYVVVTGPTCVSETDIGVLSPVPGDPERRPTKALITLTTTATLLPSPDRLIVIGELVVDEQ